MLLFYLSLIDNDEDKRTFEDIYLTYRQDMFRLARTIVRTDADAEDIVEDVFLKIASRHLVTVTNIESPTDLRNYLLKATKNTALNAISQQQHMQIVSLDIIDETSLTDIPNLSNGSFVEAICSKADYAKILTAINELNQLYRDILYYHFVLEISVPEIASHLNRKVSSVKKQLIRGKKLLLAKLDITGGNQL
ncbi:MAG: RNA polymerase sigma factor [Lachnospiraceae bacterium]|nr:RNA polymerase sigma factor [Lachnospiraceae bacterium]